MAIKKRPVSPRQKMINLMYVVLMAMLALNVSTEVLDGFSIVEDSLNRTTANSSAENNAIYSDFADQMKQNPTKVREWFEKAKQVKDMSDALYNFAQELKVAIVKEADGKNGDVSNIKNKENLEAAGIVMLAPGTGKGKKLYRELNRYRDRILELVTDEHQKKIIASNFSTQVPKSEKYLGKNWQEYMFENQNIAFMVGLAFAIAASCNFPIILLSMYWSKLTTRGAMMGGWLGLITAVVLMILGPTIWVQILGHEKAIFPYEYPALFSITVAFLGIWFFSATDNSAEGARERELFRAQFIRSQTGFGVEQGRAH